MDEARKKMIIEKQDEWREEYKKNRAAYKLQKNRAEKARVKELLKLKLSKNVST